jgi:hypothetical protein
VITESFVKGSGSFQDDDDTENKEVNHKGVKNSQDFNVPAMGILQLADNRNSGISPEPSEPSEPSAIASHEHPIYRLGFTDKFACKKCTLKDDKWFMRQHICRGRK